MDAMERNKKKTQVLIDDEEDAAREEKAKLVKSTGARDASATLGALKASNAHCF
eukprot:COSAG01_NODE_1202_length_11263_cov_64.078466_11_plen_54_part_00